MTAPCSKAWDALQKHFDDEATAFCLSRLFNQDPGRFARFSCRTEKMLFDYSKNLISDETMEWLFQLAREKELEAARDRMFAGDIMNATENRAALHALLRAPKKDHPFPEVHQTLDRMASFAHAVREGQHRGHTGKEITDIVNIGIGGSSLGPESVTNALSDWHHPRLKAHFVSNVDASHLDLALRRLSPETTLFVVVSKTFTTAETLQNARNARAWFLQGAREKDVARHFVAASTNLAAVSDFGISPDNMFPFWDWVGGRYSVWSAVGLTPMILAGPDAFRAFLSGAHEADLHFQTAPLEKNIPAIMALIGLWYRHFFECPASAVIPYHASFSRFSAWLQQLDMESNGKSVTTEGLPVTASTGPIIFGEPGTDAQHSFFQWLHQSPSMTPVDFIAFQKNRHGTPAQQNVVLANFLAQSEALMIGQENHAEPHRHFIGNRPSTTFLLDELTPETLGFLMALYEHKIFAQGILWGINSFDQWGVELGKKLAKTIEAELNASAPSSTHDSSTLGLMNHILQKE